MWEFVSGLYPADFDPAFGSEGWSIGAPDSGVDVEGRERNLEDLVRRKLSTLYQAVDGGKEKVYLASLDGNGSDSTTI